MSRLTQSIQLCFCLPRFLLPSGTISTVFLLTYSWSRLLTCPNHLNLAFRPSLSCIFSRLNGPSTGRQRTRFQHGWQHVCLPMSLVLRFDSFPLSEKCTLSPCQCEDPSSTPPIIPACPACYLLLCPTGTSGWTFPLSGPPPSLWQYIGPFSFYYLC